MRPPSSFRFFRRTPWLHLALVLLLALGFAFSAAAQTQSVGIGTTAPNAKAALEIAASDKGLLIPRMTASDRGLIGTPPTGLLVYQTDGTQPGFWYYAASGGWTFLNPVGVPDNLGNHTATTNLGLNGHWLSNAPANANGLRVDNAGNVGVGVAAPTQALDVNGGILARANGPISNQGAYLQWNRTGGAGETWLLNQQGGGGGGIRFGTATTANAVTEWARFEGDGRLGIGTTSPHSSAALDVSSTTKGFLPPRLTQTERDLIGGPAAGLTIYNTTTGKLNTWNGIAWTESLSTTDQPTTLGSQTFAYTGAVQTFTVPAGVTSIGVDARGAQGGSNAGNGTVYAGGLGARVRTTLSVTPGQVLYIYVGRAGLPPPRAGFTGRAGYNGGGAGSPFSDPSLVLSTYGPGGGGGASDIRTSASGTAYTNRLLVAAGGGGASLNGAGGAGGALIGGQGAGPGGGAGGTQTSGNALGLGGTGAPDDLSAGGGGGYWGGFQGTASSSGGGGSSWVVNSVGTGSGMTAAYQSGDGSVIITLNPTYAAPALDGSNFVNVPGTYDNLGNHTATQNLDLATHLLVGNGGSSGLAVSSTGGVGIGTATPNSSALLEVSSTTRGLLPPRMNQDQRDAIVSPAPGLTIYNTDVNKLNTYNGTSWDQALSATEQPIQFAGRTFTYTGAPQTYTVPAGVTQVTVVAKGAQGGTSHPGVGGQGAQVQTTLTVTPGQVLQVYVGGAGGSTSSSGGLSGGWNGGGSVASAYYGTAGGGATDLRVGGTSLNDRVVVAAGGGGGYNNINGGGSGNGGNGGAPIGSAGTGYAGQGATQTAGGMASGNFVSGTFGQGGQSLSSGSGGGGGGYYGGGGGGGGINNLFGSGGGGSSWVTPTGTANTTMAAAANAGNGSLSITPITPIYASPTLDGRNISGTWDVNGTSLYYNDGNVGIGSSTPSQKLEVNGNVAINTNYDLILRDTNHGLGWYGGSKSWNGVTPDGPALYGFGGGLLGTNQGGTRTTALYWNNAGNVGIGTTIPLAGLHVDRPESSSSTAIGVLVSGGTTGNPSIELRGSSKTPYLDFAETSGVDFTCRLISTGGRLNINGAGSTGILVDINGGLECTGLNNVSDRRLKQHVRPLTRALAGVLALRGVRYDWNPLGVQRGGVADAEQIGVIAQEVEAIYPELVNTGPDGFKSVNYVQLAPVLIEAIKEQQAQIEALKAQNAGLQNQVGTDHAALQTLQEQMARLLGEVPQATQAHK